MTNGTKTQPALYHIADVIENKKRYSVTLEIALVDEWNARNAGRAVLSICGVVARNRYDDLTGGQIIDYVAQLPDTSLLNGWTPALRDRLVAIWERWHLNSMRAGCDHQRALGWTYDAHPSEPCPECGYRMGSAWLFEELPLDVIEFIERLPGRIGGGS